MASCTTRSIQARLSFGDDCHLLKLTHILTGIGVAGLSIGIFTTWPDRFGIPQAADASELGAPSDGTPAETSTIPPASASQPGSQSDVKGPSAATGDSDHSEEATNADDELLPAPVPEKPHWVISFPQQVRQATRANATSGAIERHLSWTQIDLLNEIAMALPASAPDWLTIECAPDAESRRFAKEILDVFSTSHRIKNFTVRTAESGPAARGIFVTVSGKKDAHFSYSQLIGQALNAPDTPVHFGPSGDPRPGAVKIVILAAEPAAPIAQTRK